MKKSHNENGQAHTTSAGWHATPPPSPQVDAGQRLHETIVQIAADLMTLPHCFELANFVLQLQTLLPEIPDQVAGNGQVDRTHDRVTPLLFSTQCDPECEDWTESDDRFPR